MEQTSTSTKTDFVKSEEVFGGIVSHGPYSFITAKTPAALCDEINNLKFHHRIISIVFGEGRYQAFIEFDRKVKIRKEKN